MDAGSSSVTESTPATYGSNIPLTATINSVGQTPFSLRGSIMKLLTKFNLILLVLFGICGLIIAQVSYSFLISNARREVLQEAQLMMASAKAVRDYTASDVGPLLEQIPQNKTKFLAEMVPDFAAITTFDLMKQKYPEYSYREPGLNPTNPGHRAADWEADVIGYLRDHREQKQVTGERGTPAGPSLYLATPIAAEQSCLQCHGEPAAAPASMIATYGSKHGFGWKVGTVVAAQIVSVPMSVPVDIANRAFHHLLLYLVITLVITIAALDIGVYFIVISPLQLVSETADRVSKGEKNVPPLPVKGSDEIATVTASFNRMQVSLAKAFKMLE
jgi:methyl-accepting chemotaxis protein